MNVVDECELRLKEQNIDTIAFMDDTFTLNKKFVNDFCDEIKRRNLQFWWGCTSRVDTLDEELLQKMKDAGNTPKWFGQNAKENAHKAAAGK